MKTADDDGGFRYRDPNLRWGNHPPPKRLKYPALALWPLFPYHNLLW